MAIGMTYEQYWYGDPLMVRDFYKAAQLKKKREDEAAWLQGLYVYSALRATVGNLILDKNDEPNRYPEKPFTVTEDEEKAEERRKKAEERERLRLVAYLNSVMMARKQQGR